MSVSELWSRVVALWDGLSQRERLLVSAVGAILAAGFVYLAVVGPIVSADRAAHQRVEDAESRLQMMVRLRREYESINARLAGVEQRIRDNKDKQNALTLLESLAEASAVKIDSMEERKSPDHEHYRETRVDVSLKNVTLTQVVSFLHSIESSPRQFSVKGLRIKTRPEQNDTLEVAFTVSSFEAI